MEKILQIIPAVDWYAVYAQTDPPHYDTYPLACWALVINPPEEPEPHVVGLTGGMDGVISVDDDRYLMGYCTGGQRQDREWQEVWIAEAQLVLKRNQPPAS